MVSDVLQLLSQYINIRHFGLGSDMAVTLYNRLDEGPAKAFA